MEAQTNARPAAAIQKWMWLVLLACAAWLAPQAGAQWADPIGPQYDLSDFLKDLQCANCRLPREQAVAAFERFVAADGALRAQRVTAAMSLWEDDAGSWPDTARMQKIVRTAEQTQRAVTEAEQQLFDDLAANAPDAERAAVEAARQLRAAGRAQAFLDVVAHLMGNERPTAAGSFLLHDETEAVRKALSTALVSTAKKRADATESLLETLRRGMLASCKEAERQGVAGVNLAEAWEEAAMQDMAAQDARQARQAEAHKAADGDGTEEEGSEEEGSAQDALMRRIEAVRTCIGSATADKMSEYRMLQWQVLQDVARSLPPVARERTVMSAVSTMYPHMGLGWEEQALEAMQTLRRPNLPAGCVDKLKAAIQRWAVQDSEELEEGVRRLNDAMRAHRGNPGTSKGEEQVAEETARRREAAWADLQKVVEGCMPKSEKEQPEESGSEAEAQGEMSPEVKAAWTALTGEDPEVEKQKEEAGQEEFNQNEDGRESAAPGLPAEDSLQARLRALNVSDDAVVVALQVRKDLVEAWESCVSPLSQREEQLMGSLRWGSHTDEEREAARSNLAVFRAEKERMSVRLRKAFIDGLLGALAAQLTKAQAEVLRQDLEYGNPGRDETRFWSSDSEWAGGLRINPAEVIVNAGLTPDEMVVAADVLQAASSRLSEAQRSYDGARERLEELQMGYRHAGRSESRSAVERWQAQRAVAEQIAQVDKEGARKVNALRTLAESIIEEVCAKVSPESAAKLRHIRDEREFPSFFLPAALVDRACDELRLGRMDDTPEIAALQRARSAYLALAVPVRDRAIECSKQARGFNPARARAATRGRQADEWRHEAMMGICTYQLYAAHAAFVERLRASYPSDELRRSFGLRYLARLSNITLVDLPWGGPRSQPVVADPAAQAGSGQGSPHTPTPPDM